MWITSDSCSDSLRLISSSASDERASGMLGDLVEGTEFELWAAGIAYGIRLSRFA